MDFLKGNNFKKICDFYLDEYGYGAINQEEKREVPFYFVKTDYIDSFFINYKPNKKFILITHNSDYHITNKHLTYLNDELVVKWYAQNVDVFHPKITSIPIGIANEKWSHGNLEIVSKVMQEDNKKDNLIYVNFSIHTNRIERTNCFNQITKIGLKMSPNKDFESYLRELSKSLFVISPNGNGVDCHKTWESLYLKTIPIVTESTNINFYKNLPIVVIKNWEDLNIDFFNEVNYYKIWGNFDNKSLTPKNFLFYL